MLLSLNDDPNFSWPRNVFTQYFKDWLVSVIQVYRNVSKTNKNKIFISKQTCGGIKIIFISILEAAVSPSTSGQIPLFRYYLVCKTYSPLWKNSYPSGYCWRRPQTDNAFIRNHAKESAIAVATPASNLRLSLEPHLSTNQCSYLRS